MASSLGWYIKAFVVLQDSNVGQPTRVIGVKLTRAAADTLCARFPGTRVERSFADKSADLTGDELGRMVRDAEIARMARRAERTPPTVA